MPTVNFGGTAALETKPSNDAVRVNGDTVQVSDTPKALGGRVKRVFDFTIGSLAFLALFPLFAMVALAIKLTSRGPVLYAHWRIGLDGRPFQCWKFRSMMVDGDSVLERYLDAHPEERFEWETNRKLRQDPRITGIGRVLRMYSVDELPQLINVILGDMSLVGPRPVVEDELENYGQSAALYKQTRPGITGLWQVSGRSDVGYSKRVLLDAEYVSNWSLGQDCVIIARTIPAVISARGSY